MCQRALSVPIAKTSIRPGAQLTAVGSDAICPPSELHPVQPPFAWSYVLRQSAPSAPLAKTSRWPAPQLLTSGPDAGTCAGMTPFDCAETVLLPVPFTDSTVKQE